MAGQPTNAPVPPTSGNKSEQKLTARATAMFHSAFKLLATGLVARSREPPRRASLQAYLSLAELRSLSMLDEFEDDLEPDDLPETDAPAASNAGIGARAARLVSRLYRAAGAPLRSRMIACLVRPLSSLGLAGVASGAFAGLLSGADANAPVPMGDLAAYSADQIYELARFVEQASPDALQQLAGMLADNPMAASAFSAAAVMLLVRTVRALRTRKQDDAGQSSAQPRDAGESGGPARTTCGHGSISALDELRRRARERPASDPDTLSID